MNFYGFFGGGSKGLEIGVENSKSWYFYWASKRLLFGVFRPLTYAKQKHRKGGIWSISRVYMPQKYYDHLLLEHRFDVPQELVMFSRV